MKIKREELPEMQPCPYCHYEPEMDLEIRTTAPPLITYEAVVFCPNCQVNVTRAGIDDAHVAIRRAAEAWDEYVAKLKAEEAAADPAHCPTTRSDILDAAKRCVCGDREQDYGSPEDNFQTIADLWEVYIRRKCVSADADVIILPEDVAAMLAMLKIARIASGNAKADNWVDLAGYAACGGEIEAKTEG